MVVTGKMYLIVLPFVFLAALVDSICGARNTNGNTIKNILPVATMRTPPAERFGAFLRLL